MPRVQSRAWLVKSTDANGHAWPEWAAAVLHNTTICAMGNRGCVSDDKHCLQCRIPSRGQQWTPEGVRLLQWHCRTNTPCSEKRRQQRITDEGGRQSKCWKKACAKHRGVCASGLLHSSTVSGMQEHGARMSTWQHPCVPPAPRTPTLLRTWLQATHKDKCPLQP
jgi:hypothetical protein